MQQDTSRWVEVTRSQFTHETEGLSIVRDLLPETSPFQAWSNFDGVDDAKAEQGGHPTNQRSGILLRRSIVDGPSKEVWQHGGADHPKAAECRAGRDPAPLTGD